MKYLLTSLICFLLLGPALACINRQQLRSDLIINLRDLFELEIDTEVNIVPDITAVEVDRERNLALVERLTEEWNYAGAPDPDKCPETIYQTYRVRTQDMYRICNGVMRVEAMAGLYEVVYRNCGINPPAYE